MDDPQGWNGYSYARNNPLSVLDSDGMNYQVCDKDGKNCADLTDEQYDEWRRDNPYVRVNASGQISIMNEDGTTTVMGSESYYNEKDLQGAQTLFNTGRQLSDPRTIAAWYGASGALGYGLYAFGVFEAGGLTTFGGELAAGEITPTAGQTAAVERAAAQGGKKAVEKFLRGQIRALAEHQEKLVRYREAGGYTSKVESTIDNVRGLIRAAEEWLSKNQ